jgi:DNA repair exonuclease SbcCD nuclease subunit
MKTLLIGDLHIEDKAIDEIKEVFVKDILPIKADEVIQLGDFFDKSKITPREADFASWLVIELKKRYETITILSGTGRHEFLSGVKAIEHLKYLGVEVVSEYYPKVIDEKKCLFGHFMVQESKLNFGEATKKSKDLKQFDYVVLGHQHLTEEIIKNKIYHIGSIRWQHWGEVKDTYKRVMILDNGKLNEIKLKTPVPMVDVTDVTELEQLPNRVKVRPVFTSYSYFVNSIKTIEKFKNKFVEIAPPVLNFTNKKIKKQETKGISIEEDVKAVENKEVRELMLQVLKEVK